MLVEQTSGRKLKKKQKKTNCYKTCEQYFPCMSSYVIQRVGCNRSRTRTSASPWPWCWDYWLAASQASIQSLYTSTGSERSEGKRIKEKRNLDAHLAHIRRWLLAQWRELWTSIQERTGNDCWKRILSIVLTVSRNPLVSIFLISTLSEVTKGKQNAFEWEALVIWSQVVGAD